MKKVILFFVGLFLMANASFSQGVDDRAVIPVAVTLNSILRLNVVSGGNIEFNFNTLEQYTNGIWNSEAYNTKFTVASSVNWEVNIFAEDKDFIGTDDAGGLNVLPLDNVGYQITYDGTGAASDFNIPSLATAKPLDDSETTTLVGRQGATTNAGDVNQNAFIINWRCGTKEGDMNTTSILEQSLPADRYATNVFLILKAATTTID
jgi:hypothetical protein